MNIDWPRSLQPSAATAPAADYRIPVARAGQALALARAWLLLGLGALVASGLLSLLLVLARTPGVNAWFDAQAFFRVALVAHVDLSVLVWFSAMAGMLWSLQSGARAAWLGWMALWACGAGTLLMGLAAFVPGTVAIMANYVPVLDTPMFHAALLAFGFGGTLLVLHTLVNMPRIGRALDGPAALHLGLSAAALTAAVALAALLWAWLELPRTLDPRAYYEILFWGGGHALQFTWTLLMLVAWLWLAQACGARLALSPRLAAGLLALAALGVLATPYANWMHAVVSIENRQLHTWGMRLGGGVAALPIALAVLMALASRREIGLQQKPLRAALLWSVALFSAGGLIGAAIHGSNVTIPAHYHGCIVGVTLALMGLVFHLLPQLGWRAPEGRLATAQPAVYAVGQLMHIVGLVWSGGYGVQRKVAGSEQALRSASEVLGMGLMGLGGLVAIFGGLMFVLVVARAMRRRHG